MNQHDSDRIAEVLCTAGYREVNDIEQADVVMLNTCSVREKAEQKLRSEVGRLGVVKRRRPDLLIGVAGCVAQQEGQRLVKRLPQIDLMIGPDNIPELPALLADCEAGGPARVRTEFDLDAPSFLAHQTTRTSGQSSAFVTTMKGCNERCSFCVVPYTRGPERYRPAHEIIEEIRRLTAAGVKEVTLLGQTVNSYADPTGVLAKTRLEKNSGWQHTRLDHCRSDESEFPALLYAIAEAAPDLLRLRYTSPHPRHLTRSLIRAHHELSVLCQHVHMPVQSGSDRVLKRMIRRYSTEEYVERLSALQDAVPDLTLSTDIIVGFPGETRQDFEKTLELVQRVGFVGVFAFKYSQRPYTPALKLADDVSEAEKSRRLAELFEVSNAQRQAHLARQLGSTQVVLVEGRDKTGRLTGRTQRNDIVHFKSHSELAGSLVNVMINEANKNSLMGELRDVVQRNAWPDEQPRRLPLVSA
jgi:tRNA-2-methylthio-N6-dimethylallyladenosine synthase